MAHLAQQFGVTGVVQAVIVKEAGLGFAPWLISAHGNWLPPPKAQARRWKHPRGPPSTAGHPGERERLIAKLIRRWAACTADRANLPKRLRRRLLSELDGELREFPTALAAASHKPHNRYFQDLPDDVISDDTRCQQGFLEDLGHPSADIAEERQGLCA